MSLGYHRGVRLWWCLVLTACSFEKSLLPSDAPSMFDDAGREIRKWDFDTAADFGATGVESLDMTIDPLGSITPEGYIYGALVARAVQGTKLWALNDTDWTKIGTVQPVGHGLWTGHDLTANTLDLAFGGITNPAQVSVWFEGEMWINPGETFRILADDFAFLQAAYDGKTFQVLLQDGGAVLNPPAAGWYPVRIGWTDTTTGELEFDVNPGGGFEQLAHDRFRATASHLRGTFRNVYYRQVHGGGIGERGPVMSVQDTGLHATTTFDPPLPGSVTVATSAFDWSARWSGQFYALAAGTYTFRVVSDDGNRIRLGAVALGDAFVRDVSGVITTNISTELVAGWNDLIVDYNNVDGDKTFTVTVIDAPAADAALMGAAIPRERLRPVEPRVDRLIHQTTIPNTPLTILDDQAGSFAEVTAPIAAHPGEAISSIALTARVNTPSPGQLGFRLVAPNNQTQLVTMTVRPDPNGGTSHIASGVSTFMAGQSPRGAWKLGISDNSSSGSGGNSQYAELHVTMHTTAGLEQIAKTATWRSPIVENQTAVALVDFVSWSERAPAGSAVAVSIRTCAMASCDDGAWVAVTNGASPMVMPNRYIQLQIVMTSDGTREPEVDKVNVQYRTARM